MRITSLHIHPIKGCRGYPVDVMAIDAIGPVGDRRFMLVDARNEFISQREVAALATLDTRLTGDQLRVTSPAGMSLDHTADSDGPTRTVTIWNDVVVAADQGDTAAEWFSTQLGNTCRLVMFGQHASREIDPTYSRTPGAQTSFNDGYPVLVALQESLDDLNRRLANPIPMRRFRPNVVIEGAPAWSEDGWQRFTMGDMSFDAVKPCARCVVSTTDQLTGVRDENQEPLRTLAKFRVIPQLGAMFGQNVIPRGTGTIKLGDRVNLVASPSDRS